MAEVGRNTERSVFPALGIGNTGRFLGPEVTISGIIGILLIISTGGKIDAGAEGPVRVGFCVLTM
jgi:mannose/fructose/N-acetylgalactosamine-specific phosphotransferase system component IIC